MSSEPLTFPNQLHQLDKLVFFFLCQLKIAKNFETSGRNHGHYFSYYLVIKRPATNSERLLSVRSPIEVI